VQFIPFGAASVGQALGQMVIQNRFPRPSIVFLDGDQAPSPGCLLLPGGDAPERVVFDALHKMQWTLLDSKTGREFALLSDALNKAVSTADHHKWLTSAASRLVLSTEALWQAMCSEWVANCLPDEVGKAIVKPIEEALAAV